MDTSLIESLAQGVIKKGFKVILHIFFREIKTSGAEQVPAHGPCLFIVGPHANQFVDGMVFYNYTMRKAYSIMAAVSYRKPVIGHIGRLLKAIPVVRPQDIMKKGTGFLRYQLSNPYKVRGIGTFFTQEIMLYDYIVFSNEYKFQVVEITSDTDISIVYALDNKIKSVEAHENNQLYEFEIMPHIDQTPVYQEVYRSFNNKECVVIFPEGGSHDRTEMLPLKAGFAIMAFGAVTQDPTLDLKIIPVGLHYFHPDKFRSRAVVSYGEPISINDADAALFQQGGKGKHEAVLRLLNRCDQAFRSVTINAPDDDTLCVIRTACRLHQPAHYGQLSIEEMIQHDRDFAKGWTQLKEDSSLQLLTQRIKLYNASLSLFDIRDYQVDSLGMHPIKASLSLLQQVTKLAVISSVYVPAYIANIPLLWITQYVSKRKQKEALSASMVKVTAKDVLATWKVLVAIFVIPSLYLGYSTTIVLYFLKESATMSLKTKLGKIIKLFGLQLIFQYGVLRIGDTRIDIYKSIKPLFLTLRNPKAGSTLQSIRNDMIKEINTFVSRHTPGVFPVHAKNNTKESTAPVNSPGNLQLI
ncbi:hypothetical protein BDF14DRAFT_1809163 [Spinellus fusiger]|nr:hypothetical protein BDF14DRAFT_1809163 [Spinellus fusiger]